MRINAVKQKLKAGQPVFGSFCMFNSPVIVEVCGLAGLDFLIMDAEHGPMSTQDLEHMVRAAEVVGMTPIVRCAQNEQQVVLRHLDVGALGIHIPMINSGEDARTFVRWAKYQPIGARGLAGVRAADFGLRTSLGEYTEWANRETLLVAHIETQVAVENIAEIVAVPEIDVIFIGPTDLSNSFGYPGRPQEQVVQKAINYVIDAARDAGKVVGTIASDGSAAKRWVDRGVLYLAGGVHGTLAKALRDYLATARG